MASAFLVSLPLKGGMTLRNDNDSVIVWAENATMAKDLAAAALAGDAPAAAWANATATALVTGTELEGWTFTINMADPVTPFGTVSVSVTGTNGQVIDDIGTALAAALNATSEIANAAYNTSTNVLTIVAAGDAMGDWFIECFATPPSGVTSTSLIGFGETTKSVSGIFTSLDAAGVAASARTVTLVAALPALYGICKLDRG